jgi:hypothetical protein
MARPPRSPTKQWGAADASTQSHRASMCLHRWQQVQRRLRKEGCGSSLLHPTRGCPAGRGENVRPSSRMDISERAESRIIAGDRGAELNA